MDAFMEFKFGNLKIIFGPGAKSSIKKVLSGVQGIRPVILTDRNLRETNAFKSFTDGLVNDGIAFEVFSDIQSDPSETQVYEAKIFALNHQCDSVIAFGGGSILDSAKCVAFAMSNDIDLMDLSNKKSPALGSVYQKRKPLICVPTTSGTGSEMNSYAVIKQASTHMKMTLIHEDLLADYAIEDPKLTLDLPLNITGQTSIDALTHCIEGYVSTKFTGNNLFVKALAIEGISTIIPALEAIIDNPRSLDLRTDLLWGSLLGGIVLQYGSGLTHGIANTIGSYYNAPHGYVISKLLVDVLTFNRTIASEKFMVIAESLAIQGKDENETIDRFIDRIKKVIARFNFASLTKIGLTETDFPKIIETSLADKCTKYNPRKVEPKDIDVILDHLIQEKI